MYSLYERPSHELIAHDHHCPHGCHGRGDCQHASRKSNRWHGLFDTITELAWQAIRLKRDFRWCYVCKPASIDWKEYRHLLDVGLVAFVEEDLERP